MRRNLERSTSPEGEPAKQHTDDVFRRQAKLASDTLILSKRATIEEPGLYGGGGDKGARLEDFERTFKTTIYPVEGQESMFEVESIDMTGGGTYKTAIDVDNGEIIVLDHKKKNTVNWYSSDVLYYQVRSALDKAGMPYSEFDLKEFHDSDVRNEHTKDVVNSLLPEETEQELVFERGREGFKDMTKTPLVKQKEHLLQQNRDLFHNKRIEKLTLIRYDDIDEDSNLPKITINIAYKVGGSRGEPSSKRRRT